MNSLTLSVIALAVSVVVAALTIARRIGRRKPVLRCPSCAYRVGGPDPKQFHLDHRAPNRHVIHSAYGPLAELANEPGTVVTVDVVNQFKTPLSYRVDPRKELR